MGKYRYKNLLGWQVTRTDGNTARYVMSTIVTKPKHPNKVTYPNYPKTVHQGWNNAVSYVSSCKHDGYNWTVNDSDWSPDHNVQYFVCNATGARARKGMFDVVVDCGAIFTSWDDGPPKPIPMIKGSEYFVKALEKHAPPVVPKNPKYLEIVWPDQKIPAATPEFWVALRDKCREYAVALGEKNLKVMLACQGGHGRSGTAAACMSLVVYNYLCAKTAVLHVRTFHCESAVESVGQEEYIDRLSIALGGTTGAKETSKINDSTVAFLALPAKEGSWLAANQAIIMAEQKEEVKM